MDKKAFKEFCKNEFEVHGFKKTTKRFLFDRVGCRTKRDKRDLLRIVKTPEGEIVLDATGKKSGRGVYVCPDPECLRKARKSRGLERALETTIPAEVYDGLEARMGE